MAPRYPEAKFSRRYSRAIPPGWLAAGFLVLASSPALIELARASVPSFALALANGAGAAGLMLLFAQFLSSGRIELLAGRLGLDTVMGFHRFAARALLGLVALYVAAAVWLGSGGTLSQLPRAALSTIASEDLFSGVMATLLLTGLVWVALRRGRIRYEVWRALHGITAVGVTALAMHHAWSNRLLLSGPALLPLAAGATGAASVLVLIYGVRAYPARCGGWIVERVQSVAAGLHKVTLRQTAGPPFMFAAGQFVWASFDGHHPIGDHPFSIASAPDELPRLRLLIKEQGDFTSQIPRLPFGTSAFLDGPDGNLVVRQSGGPLLLIAGGVGMAPILSILRSLRMTGFPAPVRLIVGTRTKQEQAFSDEIQHCGDSLDLLWWCIVEQPSPGWDGQVGRVDETRLVQAIAGLEVEKITVLVCGPTAMMAEVTTALVRLGVPIASIDYERFDYNDADDPKSRITRTRFRLLFAALAAVLILSAGASYLF